MNNMQLSFVVGLLMTIVSNQVTGVWHVLGLIAATAFLLFSLALLVMKLVLDGQASKQPPFSLGININFKSPEERSAFGEKFSGFLQEFRREQDATNGLTTEQLADAGLNATGTPEEPVEGAKVADVETKVEVETTDSPVAVGQLYSDNDPRHKRTVKVVSVDTSATPAVAYVVNTLTGRKSHLAATTLLKTTSRGYTYKGMIV